MERLMFVPLEIFEERYTKQWYYWFSESFKKANIEIITVGDTEERPIKCGQFLDVFSTNTYKLQQMQKIISLIEEGFEGTIFFMDMWFPGIEAIGYVRDCAKKNIKIKGMLHAGTWDEWDFLSQSGLGKWAKGMELSWIQLVDEVFVATDFHRDLICDYFNLQDKSKFTIVDFPVYRNDKLASKYEKEDIVVFPHRLAKEKQPDKFETLKIKYALKYSNEPQPRFVRTKDVCKNKEEYYDFLAHAKVAFSSALQETFGIAMLEALALGCIPVAPKRLSYVETLREFPMYNNLDEAVDLIHDALRNYKKPYCRHMDNVDNIVAKI